MKDEPESLGSAGQAAAQVTSECNRSLLEWNDIALETSGDEPFTILKGISGRARGGEALAIMGPSGVTRVCVCC